MFVITMVVLFITASILLVRAWLLLKSGYQINEGLLLYPYILYFFFLLLYGKDQLHIYENQQLFTVSIGYFVIYTSLSLFLISYKNKKEKSQNTQEN